MLLFLRTYKSSIVAKVVAAFSALSSSKQDGDLFVLLSHSVGAAHCTLNWQEQLPLSMTSISLGSEVCVLEEAH